MTKEICYNLCRIQLKISLKSQTTVLPSKKSHTMYGRMIQRLNLLNNLQRCSSKKKIGGIKPNQLKISGFLE